ncbi:ABC transporter ATP-binding protein [Nonomuraea sp. NPDC047897]|uniref:ABC transporter ATP-binding protein n=1 Tax=Nonomuraea sp. NPDC047897 TaxID=3364346 RepID=UPI00371526E1
MNTPLLETRDLHVWFDLERGGRAHALRGLDLTLAAGEGLGLVGESGCGKTTAILAMMGLLPPSATVSGEVRIAGQDILAGGEAGMRPHRWTDIAMVFQGAMNAFSPVATIGEQIAEPMRLHRVAEGKAAIRRARELLELVGIHPDRADRYPHQFSGGMRQRAAIAMALACRPKVLLADEPTTALDVIVQAQVLDLLDRLRRELDLAVVLVTHDLPVVSYVCGRAAVMYAGRVVESGPVDALTSTPSHPYTGALFAAAPDIDQTGTGASIAGAPPRLDEEWCGCSFAPRCGRADARCRTETPLPVTVATGRITECHLIGEGR